MPISVLRKVFWQVSQIHTRSHFPWERFRTQMKVDMVSGVAELIWQPGVPGFSVGY